MLDYTDLDLLLLMKEGSREAYTELYKRYHAALYIHVYNKIRVREDARDIVQDLLGNLWLRRAELELKQSFAQYLYGAARYKVFDYISQQQLTSHFYDSIREFDEKGYHITDYAIREKQMLALVEREIQALPPKMRAIFELSRKEGLSHREIAEQLGISEKTVKKQVNNSLKILRSKLGYSFLFHFLF